MSRRPPGRPPAAHVQPRPVPGHEALLLGALAIGLIMLALQLWLLTVALELFLGGEGEGVWGLALTSGVLFTGGIGAVAVLGRRARVAGPAIEDDLE